MDLVLSQSEPGGNTKTPGKKQNTGTQCYRWCFTLKAEGITPSQLSQLLAPFCKEASWQLELSDSKYLHYQGVLSLKIKHRLHEVCNMIGNAVHLEQCKNWFASIKYCTKTETRVDGPWNLKSTFLKEYFTKDQLFIWEKEIIEICNEEPDTRTVYWYWSKLGNLGKSQFARYLCIHHDASYLGYGTCGDIAFAYNGAKIAIFDYPRSKEDSPNYAAIEMLKNGIMFSKKFESKQKIYNSPHIFCFSNAKPDISQLSSDRWVIKEIMKDGTSRASAVGL